VLGNHDKPRIASRIGPAQARVAAMLLLTLRGTPTLYYGDELGLANVPIPPGRVQDPWEKNTPGLGLGRDPARTPMPWDGSPKAGFTTGTPWLPLGEEHRPRNVAAQRDDPNSMLSLYRRLLALRRAEPALALGPFSLLPAEGDLLVYLRSSADRQLLVALNLGHEPQQFNDPAGALRGRILLSTHPDHQHDPIHATVPLRGDEGVIIEVSEPFGTPFAAGS
jgi:alpha-glucosidase